jgi:hypothetical protein
MRAAKLASSASEECDRRYDVERPTVEAELVDVWFDERGQRGAAAVSRVPSGSSR